MSDATGFECGVCLDEGENGIAFCDWCDEELTGEVVVLNGIVAHKECNNNKRWLTTQWKKLFEGCDGGDKKITEYMQKNPVGFKNDLKELKKTLDQANI